MSKRAVIILVLVVATGLAASAVWVVTSRSGEGTVCATQMRSFAALPYPAPALMDGDVLRVGREASLLAGMGYPLSDNDLRGVTGGDQVSVRSAFVWTERGCPGGLKGYRFVVVRAERPGDGRIVCPVCSAATPPSRLRVQIVP